MGEKEERLREQIRKANWFGAEFRLLFLSILLVLLC
jgi:hypothetical protein